MFNYKNKKELQVSDSLPLKKGPHTLHSVKYKSLPKTRWKLIQYFQLFRPNYQLEHCITKRKKGIQNLLCVGSKLTLVQVYFPGNGKDYENDFLQKKKIYIWSVYSTASDPQPQMIPRPQKIPKMDRKWSSTASDPQSWPQMIPK